MITIFSIPKDFKGKADISQQNAILSWKKAIPNSEIILCGDDFGVRNICIEHNIKHLPNVKTNDNGTPYLSSAFELVTENASNDILLYVNCDIIFKDDISDTLKYVDAKEFLLCGRRYDVDIDTKLDFISDKSSNEIFKFLDKNSSLHGPGGIDYFCFPKGMFKLKEFLVGRPGWDNWLLYHCKEKKIPIYECTDSFNIFHQNHDYSHSKFGTKTRVSGPEHLHNLKVLNNKSHALDIYSSDFLIDKGGVKNLPTRRMLYKFLISSFLYRKLIKIKRDLFEI